MGISTIKKRKLSSDQELVFKAYKLYLEETGLPITAELLAKHMPFSLQASYYKLISLKKRGLIDHVIRLDITRDKIFSSKKSIMADKKKINK